MVGSYSQGFYVGSGIRPFLLLKDYNHICMVRTYIYLQSLNKSPYRNRVTLSFKKPFTDFMIYQCCAAGNALIYRWF